MSSIGPVSQQGVVSTQIESSQIDQPAAVAQTPRVVQESPLPPVDSGRGEVVDTSA